MELWQEELVNRVCASETFRDLKHLGDLLLYLARTSRPEDRHKRTEQIIRDKVFAGGTFTIGTEVTRLQAHLNAYFDTWGRSEKARIVVRRANKGEKPLDLYALTFPFNLAAEIYTKRFWKPHLADSQPTVIVYSEPLFTRDARTTKFQRDVRINSERDVILKGQVPCYPYAPVGEIACMLQLQRWFSRQGVPTLEQGVRAENRIKDVQPYPAPADFILMGAPRANGVIKSLQDQQDWEISVNDEDIVVLGDELRARYREADHRRYVVGYVAVGRLRAPHGNVVTMFYGNHGKAIERIGQLFTSETEITDLFKRNPDLARCETIHDFQLLFEVRITDKESDAGAFELITHRFYR